MLRASLTRPSTCNGVFSVTYFSTKTSNESFFGLLKFSVSSSWVFRVCRSRSARRACAPCACVLTGVSSISKSWIPDSLWDCWDDRSLAGLEDAKHPESRGNLCRSKFGPSTFFSVSSSLIVAEAEKKSQRFEKIPILFWTSYINKKRICFHLTLTHAKPNFRNAV